MSASTGRSPLTVVLLGNPNTGKSTLFSAPAGVRQRTGNYPGVTVEKKIGRTHVEGVDLVVVDLPGTYSLAPHSPDEMVAVDVLLGRRGDVASPDVVVCIVDASNLPRNLYLTSQILELGIPMVLAVNMMDIAQRRGIRLDTDKLQQNLNVPVIPLQANRHLGLDELKRALLEATRQTETQYVSPLPEDIQIEVADLQRLSRNGNSDGLPRYLIERMLLDTGFIESIQIAGTGPRFRDAIRRARLRLTEDGQSLATIETTARYQWVAEVTEGVIKRAETRPRSIGDRLDRVLTHSVWGTLIFVLLMAIIFQSVFSWAGWFMDGIAASLEWIGGGVAAFVPQGALQSLLVNGVIAGVGGVLIFLPQIFILFLFIAILEDCGYMACAAYLMDRLMSRIGLSGKSFIPLLSSFACAIPGIMATRVIENPRDRLVTIMIAPLMSCSARLPVYTLLIAAFIPNYAILGGFLGLQSFTLLAMYSVGILTAIVVAMVLKHTILPGEVPPFVMELPSYKFPDLRVVTFRMLDRGWAFVRRAGTLIFAVTILVWAAGYFPHRPGPVSELLAVRNVTQAKLSEHLESAAEADPVQVELWQNELADLDNKIAAGFMTASYLGQAGRFIEPVVAPLGWDWRIGCAVIASFPAREVVVGTLGVIYNLGEDEGSVSLQKSLRTAEWEDGRPVFSIPVALSIMVFFALCAQCVSTLAIIKHETNSWTWPLFSFTYMTGLAYVGALLTYHIGNWFSIGS